MGIWMKRARRRSTEEWLALRQRYMTSGLSMEDFAAAEGLTGRYFVRKMRRVKGGPKSSGFVRVSAPPSAMPLVIQIGDVRIHGTESLSPAWIAAVATALRA